MKFIIIAAISLFSATTFAKDLDSTIRDIEIKRNAKCSLISKSTAISFGGTSAFYTVRYSCISNETDFGLKVRMFGSRVRKVIYLD